MARIELAWPAYPAGHACIKMGRVRLENQWMGFLGGTVLTGSIKTVYDANDFVGGEMGNGKWMRQGDYKAVSVAPPYGSGNWQLYNVVVDPGETRDLAKEQPERLKQLQAAWDHYAKDVGVVLSK